MSGYALIKDYNPAYHPWIRAALRRKRMMGDREYSLKELEHMSIDMGMRGVKDELFQGYFYHWSGHKEYQPDYLYLLRLAIPPIYNGENPDFKVISELDSEARGRGQKIILTIIDAAKDIADFYDQCLVQPLARELEGGSSREKLLNFFEFEEFDQVPDIRIHTREKVDEAVNGIATNLLHELGTITSEKVLDNIRQTLDEHYNEGVGAASPEHSYHYKAKYVKISAHQQKGEDMPVTSFLAPARGYAAIPRYYEGALYPRYYVYNKP
jgi:hypothetical protein